MKTIHRYILKELLKVFFMALFFLTMVMFMEQILFITALIVNRPITFTEGLRMVIYIIPPLLALTIPASLLIASVVTFNQLSADSEIHAMKAQGWSFMFLMRPVMYLSGATFAATVFVIFVAIPWGNQSFKQMIFDIVQNRAYFDIKTRVFNSDFKDLIFFVNDMESNNSLKNIFVAKSSGDGPSKIITSQFGQIISDPEDLKIQLHLKEGAIHEMDDNGKEYRITKFEKYFLALDLPSGKKLQKLILDRNRELSYTKLKERIARKRQEGRKVFREQVILYKKFALPFTCLLFGFAGAPLGIKATRSGKSGGAVISTFVLVSYYVLMIFTQNMGAHNLMPPMIAVWIPNMILFAFAFYVSYIAQKEKPFTVLNLLFYWCWRIQNAFRKKPDQSSSRNSDKNQKEKARSRRQAELEKTTQQILNKKIKAINSPNA